MMSSCNRTIKITFSEIFADLPEAAITQVKELKGTLNTNTFGKQLWIWLCVVILFLCFGGEGLAQTTVYFPQLADGGGYVTTFYFVGLGRASSNVTVELFGQNGTGLILQTNRGSGSSFTFALPANGQVTIRTSCVGSNVSVGWARVTSDIPIGATEIFKSFDGSSRLISQAGVLPTEPIAAATLVVAIDGKGQNTGIALANVGLSFNPLTFTLYNQAGTIVGTSTTTLSPRNQMARFIDQLSPFERINVPFEGTLSVSGLSLFSLVSLLLDGPELSAVATLPGRIPPPTSSTLQALGISYLYLAGMPDGTRMDDNTAPLNSPAEAGLVLIAGKELQFSASGSFSGQDGVGITRTVGPEGQLNVGPSDCSEASNGIGGIIALNGGLVGVFLGSTQPSPPAPDQLDFSGGVANLTRLQPKLKQPFYIGTGVTNNQSKRFVIPEGATRLFVAPLACFRSVSTRSGAFTVTVQYVP